MTEIKKLQDDLEALPKRTPEEIQAAEDLKRQIMRESIQMILDYLDQP